MEAKNKRLLALDILRGLTIILMIVVNGPGSWNEVFAPFLHAEWNGLTPTDYVFPTFLFIVGVSIVLSLSKQLQAGKNHSQIAKKIVFRALKIYFTGIFLWLWPSFNFEEIRWVGVLPSICIFSMWSYFPLYLKKISVVSWNRYYFRILDNNEICPYT